MPAVPIALYLAISTAIALLTLLTHIALYLAISATIALFTLLTQNRKH